MKSKHRHELQTNELSKILAELKPWWDRHGTTVSWGLVVVLAVALGVLLWVRSTKASRAAAWSAFVGAQTPEDLEHVATDYAGSEVAAWAKLHAAERRLAEGMPLMYTDRSAGKAELEAAQQTLEQLAADSGAPDAVRERALVLLGQVREALSDGNLQPAIEAYEQFLRQFPNSVLREKVERRLQLLKTGGAQAFYAWFAKQNPKPADLEKPKDLTGAAGGSTGQAADASRSAGEAAEPSSTSSGSSAGPQLTFPAAPEQRKAASSAETGKQAAGTQSRSTQPSGTQSGEPSPQPATPAAGAAPASKPDVSEASKSNASDQQKPASAKSQTGAGQPPSKSSQKEPKSNQNEPRSDQSKAKK